MAVQRTIGQIGFVLPFVNAEEAASFQTYVPGRERRSEKKDVRINNLRNELDNPTPKSSSEQLSSRGFAVMRHQSLHKYLAETAETVRQALDCTRVIAWNSVVRQNDADTKFKEVDQQREPEQGFVPTSRLQPIAGTAHVDQDHIWGRELCSRALGRDVGECKRVMIVNSWRPLKGPVTNAPLAMCSYDSIRPEDLTPTRSTFGTGLLMAYHPSQEWSYIRHQRPEEVILLKCFDTEQGRDGSALFCGHVAVQVDGDGIEGQALEPRQSIEVRLVAVWE